MKNRRSCHKRPAMQQRTVVAPLPIRPFRATPLALAVAAALYPASFVLAQATDDKERGKTDELQEVVVTATRREINVQSVPQSITAFSTADIEKYGLLGSAGRRRRIAERQPGEQHAGSQLDHHARRLDRFVRVLHRQSGVRLPGRPASDFDLAAGRYSPGRYRAHRIAAGAAGHAVRLELASRHVALYHQQAGSLRNSVPSSTSRAARPRAAIRATT